MTKPARAMLIGVATVFVLYSVNLVLYRLNIVNKIEYADYIMCMISFLTVCLIFIFDVLLDLDRRARFMMIEKFFYKSGKMKEEFYRVKGEKLKEGSENA